MSKKIPFMGIVMIGIGVALCGGAEPPNQVREFMRRKLTHSEQVLEGLATEDFKSIAQHAQQLSLLSQATTWQVLQTADYLDHSSEFRRAADRLTEAARKKNLDGAALAYVDMTMSCINCHKYVRETRAAGK
jgi:cytochrome c556